MTKEFQCGAIVNGARVSEQEIRDEIVFLERRLSSMATDDSAYERLLARAYDQLLNQRRSQLAQLLGR